MSHLQTTSFLAYFPHSSRFFPPWERPEFVKKSHFLDETTPAERTSYLKNENNFTLFSSLQMTKVPCGRALDSALAPNRGIALPGPKMWQKIHPIFPISGGPVTFRTSLSCSTVSRRSPSLLRRCPRRTINFF